MQALNKIRVIVVDDMPNDIKLCLSYLSKLEEIEVIGTASRVEEARVLLKEQFHKVDLVIMDMTLVPGGDPAVDLNNGPGLLEQIRKEQNSRPGRYPFGIIYMTHFIEFWAINFVLQYQPPATLLRFVAKNHEDQEERNAKEQLIDGIERFKKVFFPAKWYDQQSKKIIEKWYFKENYLDDYLSQKIAISGRFGKEGEDSLYYFRREQIGYLCRRDGFCEIKIKDSPALLHTEDSFQDINEYLWWTDDDKASQEVQEYRSHIATQFAQANANCFVNIDYIECFKTRIDGKPTPHGGYVVMEDKAEISISNIEHRDRLKLLSGK
jgi:CheY-like chemotaxis protein